MVPTSDRLAPLEYVVLASRERLRVDLDLDSTVEWARKSAEQLRRNGPQFSGGSPTGSNPLPEPTAALLFGAGLTAFAASRRSRRR